LNLRHHRAERLEVVGDGLVEQNVPVARLEHPLHVPAFHNRQMIWNAV